MIVPGRVEGINLLVDLKGLYVTQIPVAALEKVYKTLGSHYCGRTFKFYVVNMPWSLRMLINVAKSILSERQAMKINVLSSPQELLKEYAPHQIESDLGGTHPPVKQFFPFPLLQGPFTAQYKNGPSSDRVPNVHRVLTMQGARGRLWDDNVSSEDNTKLVYSEEAKEILKKCRLPVPVHCPGANEDDAAELHVEAAPSPDVAPTPEPMQNKFKGEGNAPAEETQPFEVDIVDDGEMVKPKSFWSCACCSRTDARP